MLQKIATLAKRGEIEGKCATDVRKSVQGLTANLKYKLCILIFALYVWRMCSIYVSLFHDQSNSISH